MYIQRIGKIYYITHRPTRTFACGKDLMDTIGRLYGLILEVNEEVYGKKGHEGDKIESSYLSKQSQSHARSGHRGLFDTVPVSV